MGAVPEKHWYLLDLIRAMGARRNPAKLYPILARLEQDGEVISGWEEGDHYPRRRWYALADPGNIS